MALLARSKPTSHNRKRQAAHHRRNKRYIKTYLPYLPMLVIVGIGAVINRAWVVDSTNTLSGTTAYGAQTRLGNLTNHSSNILYVALALTFVAFAIFLLLNGFRLQRMLNKGEAYMVKHPLFDISLVIIITAGIVLTRS